MKSKSKTISTLELKKQELLDVIDETEIQIGNQLLTAGITAVENELLVQYNVNATQKQELIRSINEIERLIQKSRNIQSTYSDTKKCMKELDELSTERYELLGKYLYEEFSESMPEVFISYYEEAKKEENLAFDTNLQIQMQKDEIKTAPFFSKIIQKIKLPSLNQIYAAHMKRRNELLILGAKEVVAQGKECLEKFNASEKLKKAFENCISFENDSQKQKDFLQSTTMEESNIKSELLSLGVADSNGRKKIVQLRQEIQKIESDQSSLCHEAGHSYVNLYSTKEGEKIVDCTGICADLVEKVQNNRATFVSYSRRIEILKLISAQEEAEKKIESFKQSAIDLRQKIDSLEDEIILLEEKISAASAARDTIVSKRALLENEEASSVKLIKEAETDCE